MRAAATRGTLADRLADALRAKEILLVLDNCEQLIGPVAALAARLLSAVPALRILATSQEPLGLAGEVIWAVPPLEVPGTANLRPGSAAEDVLASVRELSAVRLFVARAVAAAPGFALDADNAPAVAMICWRLDGIPLALELAATRGAAQQPGLRALRLDPVERDHLYRLARPWPQSDRADAAAQQVRPGLRRLLDSTEVPSYIVGRNTDVLAWNPLAAALVTDFGALPPRQRNLARLVFLDEGMRSLYADWRDKASDVAAYLRLDAGRHPGDPRTAALIDEVTASSPELRQAWSEQSRKAPPPTQRFNCWRPGPKRVSDPIRPGRPRSRRTRGIRRTRARSDRTGSCRPR